MTENINSLSILTDIEAERGLNKQILVKLMKLKAQGKDDPHELYTFAVRLDGRKQKAEKYLKKLKKRLGEEDGTDTQNG